MHKVCDYNFQIHRKNGQRAIPRSSMSRFGELNLGQLALQLNQILSEVVTYPNITNLFSLLCVEHQNGLTSGWSKVNISMPGTVLRFHFMLDRNLVVFGQPTIQHGYTKNGLIKSSRLVRQHVAFSDLIDELGGGRIMTIGLSAKELAINHEALLRTLDELELLYKILGMTTKAHKVYKGQMFKDSEHLGTVLANNQPQDYHRCISVWKRYPNLIPSMPLSVAEHALEFVQPYRRLRDSGNRIISLNQRSLLGVTTSSSYNEGLLHWIYQAVRSEMLQENKQSNRCLEICFANFSSEAKSVAELAKKLWSIDEALVKQNIHALIWSRK